jgi:hypothetical protein
MLVNKIHFLKTLGGIAIDKFFFLLKVLIPFEIGSESLRFEFLFSSSLQGEFNSFNRSLLSEIC